MKGKPKGLSGDEVQPSVSQISSDGLPRRSENSGSEISKSSWSVMASWLWRATGAATTAEASARREAANFIVTGCETETTLIYQTTAKTEHSSPFVGGNNMPLYTHSRWILKRDRHRAEF